jgi:hypothetical protein
MDKHRHPRTPAPRGAMSGWALTLFMACAAALLVVARAIG